MDYDTLIEAQLRAYPDSIIVSITELERLMDKHLGYAGSRQRKELIDQLRFDNECIVCYVIPRKGKNERPWFGIRMGTVNSDYHSFS